MLKLTYRKCQFIGYSEFNTSRGPMKELYFVCEEAEGFKNHHGKLPIIDKMTDEKLNRLLAYQVKDNLILGKYYNLVRKDYNNDHELHIRTIYPYKETVNEQIPEFNPKVDDSGEDDDLTF